MKLASISNMVIVTFTSTSQTEANSGTDKTTEKSSKQFNSLYFMFMRDEAIVTYISWK